MSVMEHLDKHECVYKLSRSVKTNRGVGKIAMTQKRLFLLAEGRPGYVEISTFRNIEVRAGLWLPAVGPPLHAAPAEPRAPARTVISLTASLFLPLQDVRSTMAAFLLLRIPTLKIKTASKKEVFEANLKTECDLWHLMVKEMWAGRKLADDHKVCSHPGLRPLSDAQHKARATRAWAWAQHLVRRH